MNRPRVVDGEVAPVREVFVVYAVSWGNEQRDWLGEFDDDHDATALAEEQSRILRRPTAVQLEVRGADGVVLSEESWVGYLPDDE